MNIFWMILFIRNLPMVDRRSALLVLLLQMIFIIIFVDLQVDDRHWVRQTCLESAAVCFYTAISSSFLFLKPSPRYFPYIHVLVVCHETCFVEHVSIPDIIYGKEEAMERVTGVVGLCYEKKVIFVKKKAY